MFKTKFVQKTIKKRAVSPAGQSFFGVLQNLPKKPLKKRLYPPRDSRFLEFNDFSHKKSDFFLKMRLHIKHYFDAKFVQKTITKNGCISRGTVVFWSVNLQKMDKFCKICPKTHYKKRLYLPRDSRCLRSKSSKNGSILQNLSKTPLHKTAVSPAGQSFFGIYSFFSHSFCNITTLWCNFNKSITNLDEFYIF